MVLRVAFMKTFGQKGPETKNLNPLHQRSSSREYSRHSRDSGHTLKWGQPRETVLAAGDSSFEAEEWDFVFWEDNETSMQVTRW